MVLKEYYTLVTNIKYYRKVKKLTQEQLAEQAELSVSYIKQLESCKKMKNITITSLAKIAKALDIHIQALFTENKSHTEKEMV